MLATSSRIHRDEPKTARNSNHTSNNGPNNNNCSVFSSTSTFPPRPLVSGNKKLDDVLEKFTKTDEKFKRLCFELSTVDKKQEAGTWYLRNFFSMITVIESHQTKFMNAFHRFLRKFHCVGTKIKPTDASKALGHIVAELHRNSELEGFHFYPYEFIILWLMDFLFAEPSPITDLYTISELPRPYLCIFFDTNKDRRKVFSPLRRRILSRVLKSTSPDLKEWWDDNIPALAARAELLMLQCDRELLRIYEDNLPQNILKLRVETAVRQPFNQPQSYIPRHQQLPIDINEHRVAGTIYLHLAYMLSRLPKNVLEKAANTIGIHTDLLVRVFPTAVQMLNSKFLNSQDPSLLELYELENGLIFRTIAEAIENIRVALMSESTKLKDDEDHARNCYFRTADLHMATSVYFATRQRILVDMKLTQNTRWAYTQTIPLSFTDFLYSLEKNIQDIEQTQVGLWLSMEASSRFKVRLYEILQAQSFMGNLNKIWEKNFQDHRLNENLFKASREILDHISECNQQLVAMRFHPSVRYHQLSMTFEFICQLYPKRMNARRTSHKPGGLGQQWTSSTMFIGADCCGPYLVAFRDQLEILRQLQLLASLQSNSFQKSMPVFPILSRMYFGKFSSGNPAVSYDNVDDHGIHVVVQVLAHWMGLPTFSQVHPQKPIGGGRRKLLLHKERKKKKSEKLSSLAVAERPSPKSPQTSYIPNIDDKFFWCFKHLHLFADRLHCIAKDLNRDFPSMHDLNAFAEFLELRRPRTLPRSLLKRLLEEMDQVEEIDDDSQRSKLVNEIRSALRATLSNKKQVISDVSVKKIRIESDDDNDLLTLSSFYDDPDYSPSDRDASANWTIIFAPIINNFISPELQDELISASIKNRPEPISMASFAEFVHYSACPSGKYGSLGIVYSNYNACFCTPSSQSQRTFRLDLTHFEQSESLMILMKYLEEQVSFDLQRNMMREKMMIQLKPLLDPPLDQKSPRIFDREELLKSDARSMLPIQVYFKGTGKEPTFEFSFYESSLCLVFFTGTEFSRFVGIENSYDDLSRGDDYSPTQTSKCTDDSYNRLLDMVLRFSPLLNLENARQAEAACLTYREFIREYNFLPKDPFTGLVDRSKLACSRFRSNSMVLNFMHQIQKADAFQGQEPNVHGISPLPPITDPVEEDILKRMVEYYLRSKPLTEKSASSPTLTNHNNKQRNSSFFTSKPTTTPFKSVLCCWPFSPYDSTSSDEEFEQSLDQGGSFLNADRPMPLPEDGEPWKVKFERCANFMVNIQVNFNLDRQRYDLNLSN